MLLVYFIISYLLLFGIPFSIGYGLIQKRERQWLEKSEHIQLNELVVIIPFRNEELRIEKLLDSIQLSTKYPKEFIFVNDHSTDQTVTCIHDHLKNYSYRILELPEGQSGKKRAIRWGIKHSESRWILSMDADVCFERNYMHQLEQLQAVAFNCLPVHFQVDTLFDRIASADVILANAFNTVIFGWKRPIMASGANLVYSRASFLLHDRFKTHEHHASGDDVFLLRDFRNAGAAINLTTNPLLSVQTQTPKTVFELMHQRLRWLSKTSDVHDSLSNFIAIYQALLTFLFTALLLYTLFSFPYLQALKLWGAKSVLDMLLLFPYFKRTRHLKTWCILPVYELILPFYTLLLLLLLKWFRPVWKNRTV